MPCQVKGISCALLMAGVIWLAPGLTHARLIWIYQEGETVAYPVSDDVEFYSISRADINQANAELLGEVLGYEPQVADVGYGSTKYEDGDVHYSEWYTRRRGAVYIKDVAVLDYLSPGDWRGLFGEYFDPGASYFELDKSGPHWSFDAEAFTAFGWVFGLEDEDLVYNDRRRRQADVRWRRGSMDGGVWRLDLHAYRVSIDAGLAQPRDVKHLRGEAGFRMSEPDFVVEGGLFHGAYNSRSAQQDNVYAGGRVDGEWWLADSVSVAADAKYTRIDAQQQGETVGRTDAGASLAWELGELATLSAKARVVQEDTDLAANSHLTGYQDFGTLLEIHPSESVRLAADYRQRNLDYQRLRLEDPAALDFVLATTTPLAEDLAGLREPQSATSDRYRFEARFKLTPNLLAGADYSVEDFAQLPQVGQSITSSLADPYFGDERSRGSAYVQYLLGYRTSIGARGSVESKRNSVRDSAYTARNFGLHCSAPAGRGATFLCGVSHRESEFDLPETGFDWDSDAWNYDVALTGAGGLLESYRLSYRWQDAEGTSGSDSQGLGLEFRLKRYPLYVASWWRDRETTLPGERGSFDDAGINITYRIDFRRFDLPDF